MKQYIWQQFDISTDGPVRMALPQQLPPGLDAPAGYRMHSWFPSQFSNNAVQICWVRESNIASNALAHIPPELSGPALEWFKRWILKIM